MYKDIKVVYDDSDVKTIIDSENVIITFSDSSTNDGPKNLKYTLADILSFLADREDILSELYQENDADSE